MSKKEFWTTREIINLFRVKKTKTSIYNDEEKGLIPKADRIKRGNNNIRCWQLNQLPLIGERYGFIKKPRNTKVISVYTPKGGVLKTTFVLNLSRILALHNIRVLVIGLDIQCSITNNLMPEKEADIADIADIKSLNGLYDVLKIGADTLISKVIHKTDIHTLDFIPENASLNLLEQVIRDRTKREHILEKALQPVISNYDVVIFDNSPNWNFLIQNTLTMATNVISPISCDVETYRSLTQNIELINNFKKNMELKWDSFTLIPTKMDRTKLSTQIEAQYRAIFPEIITNSTIRSAAIGQESSLEKISVIEYDSKCALADDYYNLISDLASVIGFI